MRRLLARTWACSALTVLTVAAGTSAPAAAVVPTAEATARARAPFGCAGDILLIAGADASQLFEGATGPGAISFAPVGSATVHYNAIGVNPVDRYSYAIKTEAPGWNLLRIDDAGAVTDLGTLGLPTPTAGAGTYASGTFDTAGNYYVANGSDTLLQKIDVTAKTFTTITLSQPLNTVIDFAYSGGYLWGTSISGDITRIDPVTGTVTTYPGVIPASTIGFGGAFTYGNGDLGFFDNNGLIYRVAVTDPATPEFTVLSSQTAPAMSRSVDATSCFADPVDLGVTKTGPTTVLPGGNVSYTIQVTNNGPNPSSGWTLNDAVPAGLTNAATTTAGCTITGGSLSCTGGPLAVGASAPVTLTGTAADAATTIVNTATVRGNDPDPNPDNDTSTFTTTVTRTVDLAVVKTGPATVAPGGEITYSIEITNNGPQDSTGWTLTDTIPAGVTGAATSTPGCGIGAGVLTCTGGPLANGASTTLTVTGNAAPGATTVENTARVTGKEPDPVPGNNTSTITTTVTGTPGLTIVKKQHGPVTVQAGATVGYTVTVTNNGTTAFTDVTPARFTDDLTDLLDDAVYNDDATATRGTVAYSEPVLEWSGALAPGQSATITFTVTTNARPFGNLRLDNTITSDTPGNNCPDRGTDPRCTTHGKVKPKDKEKDKAVSTSQGSKA
ncbi:DUF6923 family protein [Streptomyces sp. NPDC051567]|uniref:DUF6923 family protein n=1 Tax=Streptomyces sp. NPDC051567 TaxID=3365660 RepID=UPI00378EF82E